MRPTIVFLLAVIAGQLIFMLVGIAWIGLIYIPAAYILYKYMLTLGKQNTQAYAYHLFLREGHNPERANELVFTALDENLVKGAPGAKLYADTYYFGSFNAMIADARLKGFRG